MFPFIAVSMSASVGCGLAAMSAAADMICPGWQYPHWTTSTSAQARWTGCFPSDERPSMVTIFLPATLAAVTEHERTALPSTWTVQAPHSDSPQPYFVPTRPMMSRSTQRSGISSGASTERSLPFTLSFMGSPPRGAKDTLRGQFGERPREHLDAADHVGQARLLLGAVRLAAVRRDEDHPRRAVRRHMQRVMDGARGHAERAQPGRGRGA